MSDTTGQRANDRPAVASPVLDSPFRRLWRLFWTLVLLQVIDLATTFFAVATGGAREGNPLLHGLMFIVAVPVLKALALVFLALLIVRSTNWGRPAPERLLVAVRVTVWLYLAIVANNVIVVLRLR